MHVHVQDVHGMQDVHVQHEHVATCWHATLIFVMASHASHQCDIRHACRFIRVLCMCACACMLRAGGQYYMHVLGFHAVLPIYKR